MSLREVMEKGAECIPVETIAALAEGTLTDVDTARVKSHIASCPACDAELAVAVRCLVEPADAAETAEVASIAARLSRSLPFGKKKRWWRKIFAASPSLPAGIAAACAALALIVYVGQRPQDPGLDTGSGAGAPVMRSGAVQLISPAGDLSAPPAEFVWEPAQGAGRYIFELQEVDGNVVFRSETESSRLTPPAAAARGIVPGKTLLWKVTALGDGAELATSGPQRFRVKP